MATVEIIESGDIYFLYRPRVGQEEVSGPEDVQRLHLVLHPRDGGRYRRLIVGRKRLPDPAESGRQRFWGFVDSLHARGGEVSDELGRERYSTRTRGERVQPEARPVGEGVYALARHDDHSHLLYRLELPRRPAEPQEELNIEPEASFVISIKNPEAPSPPGAGLPERQAAELPGGLLGRFGGRRFLPVEEPSLLDHEGVEFVLIAAAEDIADELGIELDAEQETADTADLFEQLAIDRRERPTKPLLEQEWQ